MMKKMRNIQYVLTVISVSTFAFFTPLSYANQFLAFDLKYQKGDFGTTTTNTVTALNFSAGLIQPNYDLEVSIPMVNSEVEVDGSSADETGVGDLVIRGGYELLTIEKEDIDVYGSMAVKFPTADETKGLGTGETDIGIFLGLSKNWQKNSGNLFAGYIINGDPAGLDIKDIFTYSIGISRFFDKSSGYVSLDGQQSTVSGAEDPLALHTGFYHILTFQYLLRSELSLGLSDGSPDYGLSFGIVKIF